MRSEASSHPDPRLRALLPEQPFERALRRERQRSDRCNSDVALIRLELPAANGPPDAQLETTLGPVFQRVRALDELGWIAPGVVGILLPETGGQGAWTLLGDLLERDASGLLCSCKVGVYAYPVVLPEDLRPARGARPGLGTRREPGEPTHAG